jgi:drug/metabolite transporter (DMT)-like permease
LQLQRNHAGHFGCDSITLIVRSIILTTLAMIAFAGNSLLCRAALKETAIDAASFTTVRLIAGALTLWLIVRVQHRTLSIDGNWRSGLALFAYAAALSYAYIGLSTATGAILLFGAVQVTMISHGIWAGERLRPWQLVGFVLAFGGLIGLLLPGLSAPPLFNSALMLVSGFAWGNYSLRGKGTGDPTSVTAGNFLRTVPLTLILSLLMIKHTVFDVTGFWYAVSSGAITSGIGYAIWYAALPGLRAATAATVQLSVPVIAAIGGIVFLSESLTLRLVLASITILGGIALVILQKPAGSADL